MGNTPNAANSPDFEILVGVATSEGGSIGNSVELIKAQLSLIMSNLSKNPGFNVLVGIDEKTKGKFEDSLKQIVDNIKLEVEVDSKTSSSPTVASPPQTVTPPSNGGGTSTPKNRSSSSASFLNNKSLVIENAWQKAKLDNVNLQKISGSYVQLNNTIKEHSQLARELSIKEKATLNARVSRYIELIKKQKELQTTESQAESNQKYLNSKSSSVNKLKGKIEEYGFDDKYKDKLLQNVSEVENAITDYSTNATALTDKEKGVLESKLKLLDKNIEKVYKLNELEKKSTLATTPDQKYLNNKAFDLEKRKSLIEEYTLSDERKEELLKNIAEVESVVTAYSEKTTQLTDKEKAAIEAKIKTLTENINKVRKLEESEKKAALAPSYNDKYLNSKSLTFERQKTKIEEYGFDDKYKEELLQNIAEIDSVFSDYSNRKTNLTNKEKAALEAKLAILDEEVKKTKKASDAERSAGEYNEVYVRKSQNALRELVNIKSKLKNSDYNEEFKKIAELFENTEKSGLSDDFEEANGALSSFKKKLTEAGVLGNNLFTNIDTKVRSFTSYLVGSGMVMMFIKQLTDALSVIKKIDDSLTTVDMTMRLTRSEMKLLGSQSIQIAKEFSTSIENVLNVLDIFTNRASGLTNLVEKMRATMMLSTATGLTSTASSDLIQGAMFQFDYDETEENFMKIVDVIESVSASVGVDFQESVRQISEGIKTSGSIAAEAGYSLEEYSSIIATLVERTRKDGSEIANSLKMIFSRLGQNRDGESTAEEISQVESAYKSLGVEIRSSATEFRDIPDVFEDLSKQWKNLTDVQRAYIAEVSAGEQLLPEDIVIYLWIATVSVNG